MAKRGSRCDGCAMPLRKKNRNHKRCRRCAKKHAFARLAVFNERKKRGEVLDRRRGIDITCPCGCGMSYAGFRAGVSFLQQRRDIIAIGTDHKTGKTKYGRRNGVLGFMREIKQAAWKAMIAEHEAARR